MKSKFSNRFLAYLIDIIIVALVFLCLNSFMPKNHNISVLENEITDLRSSYLKKEIDTKVYFNRYALIRKNLDQQYIPSNLLNVIIILCYFVLIPYYWDGKTIGKKIFKLKIVKSEPNEKVCLNNYLVRSIINNGVLCFLISMSTVFLFDDSKYLLITIICGILQFLLVIISGFMIIYRHDKKGVHDLVSGTQVIKEG